MATAPTVNQTIYLWQGTDKNGKKTKGEMPGASQALVKAQLRKQGVNHQGQAQAQGIVRPQKAEDQPERHRDLQPPTRHHDEGRHPPRPILRDRQR